MSCDVAQSLGRIVLIAFVLLALLALLTTPRVASTRDRHRRRSIEGVALEYFDGRQWTSTPPPPRDDAC